PGRPRGGDPPERARRRPEPELAGRLEARRRALGRLLLGPAADVGAGEPGDARLHPARQAGADDLVPPATRRGVRLRSARRGAEAVRAADGVAVPSTARSPGGGDALGTAALPERRSLRGRVRGGADLRGNRPPPRGGRDQARAGTPAAPRAVEEA